MGSEESSHAQSPGACLGLWGTAVVDDECFVLVIDLWIVCCKVPEIFFLFYGSENKYVPLTRQSRRPRTWLSSGSVSVITGAGYGDSAPRCLLCLMCVKLW